MSAQASSRGPGEGRRGERALRSEISLLPTFSAQRPAGARNARRRSPGTLRLPSITVKFLLVPGKVEDSALGATRPADSWGAMAPYLTCWTRSQSSRTLGEQPFQAILFEATTPVYRRIAQAASRLRVLGLSLSTIATELGVSDKTVAKALGSILDLSGDIPIGCQPFLPHLIGDDRW